MGIGKSIGRSIWRSLPSDRDIDKGFNDLVKWWKERKIKKEMEEHGGKKCIKCKQYKVTNPKYLYCYNCWRELRK
ncbi:MAG: hypothetical protein AABX61_02235 [Nanoarchaeota archaeon]